MEYTRDAIFDYVANKVNAFSADAIVTSKRLRVAPSFPAVELRQVDKSRTRQNITLDFSDKQNVLMFEAQVFCDDASGGLTQCYAIMEEIESAFNDLYFIESTCGEVENESPEISRVVARFSRQIGDGDAFPTGGNNNQNNLTE